MMEMIRPILELTVIIPGMLLAYLPVKECLKQAPVKLALWLTPLLLTLSLSGIFDQLTADRNIAVIIHKKHGSIKINRMFQVDHNSSAAQIKTGIHFQ